MCGIVSIVVARVEFTLDDHGDVVWFTPPAVEVDGLFLTTSYRVNFSPTHCPAMMLFSHMSFFVI